MHFFVHSSVRENWIICSCDDGAKTQRRVEHVMTRVMWCMCLC